MYKEKQTRLEEAKKMLAQANDDVTHGRHLNFQQQTAKEIIGIEREFFYGDINNYKRRQAVRDQIERSFKAMDGDA